MGRGRLFLHVSMTLSGIAATLLAPVSLAFCSIGLFAPETNPASPYWASRAFSNFRCDYRSECEGLGYLDPALGFVCREDDAWPAGSCVTPNFLGWGICEWINA